MPEEKTKMNTEKKSTDTSTSMGTSGEQKTASTTTQQPQAAGMKTEVPAKFAKIVEEIEKMPVLELNELVKVFEEKFGVSSVAVAAGPASAEGSGEAKEEKSVFDIELTDGGAHKIAVIKVVKAVAGLGLKEAKDLVDGVPSMVKQGVKKEEAEEIKKKVEEAGGKVTLK